MVLIIALRYPRFSGHLLVVGLGTVGDASSFQIVWLLKCISQQRTDGETRAKFVRIGTYFVREQLTNSAT